MPNTKRSGRLSRRQLRRMRADFAAKRDGFEAQYNQERAENDRRVAEKTSEVNGTSD